MTFMHPGHGATTQPIRSSWWDLVLSMLRPRSDDEVPAAESSSCSPAYTTQLDDFETFFRRYERSLTGYLWRMTGDDDLACDLAQETFVRAWQRFEHLQTYAFQQAWLFRVATNLALSHTRRHASPINIADLQDGTPQLQVPDPMDMLGEREVITQILQNLSPRLRAVLILRTVYGLSFRELGTTLGISFEAAKIALRRARAQFRAEYHRKEAQDS